MYEFVLMVAISRKSLPDSQFSLVDKLQNMSVVKCKADYFPSWPLKPSVCCCGMFVVIFPVHFTQLIAVCLSFWPNEAESRSGPRRRRRSTSLHCLVNFLTIVH